MAPIRSCRGVRCVAALSNRHVLVLASLIGLVAGIPQSHIHESHVELDISPRGDLVRREGAAAAGLADLSRGHAEEPADISQDGAVTVVAPAQTKSEQIKLEELNEECMQTEPLAECMQKYGSYGLRKLFTESWENVKKLGYLRPDWMAHHEVQRLKLFELTLPGSVNAGTYAITGEDANNKGISPYGVISQSLTFYQQLQLGVRMLGIRVGYSSEHKMVYTSHGALMVPLSVALADVRKFLEENKREIIVLDVAMDETASAAHLRPIIDENEAMTRIPGQLVHEVMECELKEMLATYKVLSLLPKTESLENPNIGALADVGGRVLYFWNSQQVLCTSFAECKTTPGWHPPDHLVGYPFAFGHPFPMGKRINVTGGRRARIIEPACSTHSSVYTKDDQPERLLKKIKIYAGDMKSKIMENRPKCFPQSEAVPAYHTPTLWYTIDGFVMQKPQEQTTTEDRMRGVKAIYTRGEGFNERTEAERTNYLMLSWFLKQQNQAEFITPNSIMFEFAGSASVAMMRLIEAMQGHKDCGYAIYCKASGSCWADTLLGSEDESGSQCVSEETVLNKLKDHANGESQDLTILVIITMSLMACGSLICVGGCCLNMYQKLGKATHRRASGGEDSLASSLPGSEAASDYGDQEDNALREAAALQASALREAAQGEGDNPDF